MDVYRDAKGRGMYPPLITDPSGSGQNESESGPKHIYAREHKLYCYIIIIGEQWWMYTETQRVEVCIHRSSPTLRGIVVLVFTKSDG